MNVFDLEKEAERLRRTEGEIGHQTLVERPGYRAGIVRFRRGKSNAEDPEKPKEITHPDLDVLAHVIGGSGTLTVRGESRKLVSGTVLHLPAGTPHDFAAVNEDLVLFYTQIQANPE